MGDGQSRRRAMAAALGGGLSAFAGRRHAAGQGPPASRGRGVRARTEAARADADEDAPFLHEEAWRKTFEGWSIVDCAVRTRGILYLVLRRDVPPDERGEAFDADIPTRFVALFLDEADPAKIWAHQGLEGFRRPRCGACRAPIGQGMAVGANGDVYASGSKKSGMEQVVADGEPASIERVRCIADRAYAVGMFREVYRRVAVGRWEAMGEGLPALTRAQMQPARFFDVGFRDIDGFAADDLYAVGGKGDVWHFDGTRWAACRFPGRLPLFNVCCAGDGDVYVGGEGGTLYRGRGDRWERVRKAEMMVPYNAARWYGGRLWLASDYRVDQLVGGEVVAAQHEGRRVLSRGHMDAADGLLVVAGLDTVRAFDGTSWRTLVRPY